MSNSGGAGGVGGPQNWAPDTHYAAGALCVYQGILYQSNADFTSGASFNQANWTVIGAPTELGYADNTSNQPPSPFVNSTTPMAIPGLSVTVSTGSRPILVDFYGLLQSVSTNYTTATLFIYEDGTQISQGGGFWGATSNQLQPISIRMGARRNPTPGSHTYAIYGQTNVANATWWILGAANNRPFIRVVQQ